MRINGALKHNPIDEYTKDQDQQPDRCGNRPDETQEADPSSRIYDFSGLNNSSAYEIATVYVNEGFWIVHERGGNFKSITRTQDCEMFKSYQRLVGITTGNKYSLIAISCKNAIGRRTLKAMTLMHSPIDTIECTFKSQRTLLFRAPAEAIDSRDDFLPGLTFLGENGYFFPDHGSWASPSHITPLPDWMLDYITGKAKFDQFDRTKFGDMSALNGASRYEAALAYDSFGWRLYGNGNENVSPTYWKENPEDPIYVEAGSASGVVGLLVDNYIHKKQLEDVHGKLTLPAYACTEQVYLYRAPQERFPSKQLSEGVEFVSDGDFLLLPPYTIDYGKRLLWEESDDFTQGLPDVPQWLHELLSAPEDKAVVAATYPQLQGQVAKQRTTSSSPLAAALDYAARGWLVFPVKAGEKRPLVKWKTAATIDRKTITNWWRKHPDANVAVVTGEKSGIVVLDVDASNGKPGLRSLAELEAIHGPIKTLRARTPRGGFHLFFHHPGQTVSNSANEKLGLDIRGDGGYVIAAPSRFEGKLYTWENLTAEIAEMPGWLISTPTMQRKTSKGTANGSQERISIGEALKGVQEGSRNTTIFRLAWMLRLEYWEYDEALVLVKTAAGNCQPPLPEDEALRCLNSAWNYSPPVTISEIGNAERFVARYGDNVRYVPDQNRWLVWSGNYWKTNTRAVHRMAKDTIRSLRIEARSETDAVRKKLLFSHCRKSESEEGLNYLLALAGKELAVNLEDLDRCGLIAFTNGVYDLKSKSIRSGRREDLLTKHVTFPYDSSDPECIRLLEGGASLPTHGMAAKLPAQRRQEEFEKWLAERCEVGNGLKAKASDLLEDFSTWLGEEVTLQRFGRLLSAKKFEREKSNVYWYHGLKLRNRTSAAAR